MISICNKIAEVNIVALKNIGIYALHDTLASTTAKDDGKQVVYDCSHASTWLRHPNMLPLRGGWQATRFSLG